ncbi:hypothetical protein [Pseudomonas sp.]|uniref:hypothetical protein n=1 Tax=Pseudomonas sp. TaxID=306 RepID=UPI0026101188|nr:hypothetical protein [Pseudomonas sp.]
MRTMIYSAILVILGACIGSGHVQSKWDKEKLTQQSMLIKQQDRIKQLEREHTIRESQIIVTFNEAKKEYENTISNINSDHSDSLHEHEERANYYRQEYQQCSDKRIIERAVLLDRYLQEGTTLVRELEQIIIFKEQLIMSLDAVIDNDRLLINAE